RQQAMADMGIDAASQNALFVAGHWHWLATQNKLNDGVAGGDPIYDIAGADGTAGTADDLYFMRLFEYYRLFTGAADMPRGIDDPSDVDRTALNSNDDTCQQGAARYGIGILVDFRGTDHYHSVRMSQGSAVMGVGLLADYGAGNDTHDMECLGQGGAYGGVGV